jgi:hypothetical protein
MDELIIKFTGDTAETHQIPAYEGGQAIEGIARGLVLVGHYLAEGEIRKRLPFSDNVQVLLRPPRAGSFDAVFGFAVDSTAVSSTLSWMGAAAASGVVGSLAYDLIKQTFKTVVGQKYTPETPALQKIDAQKGGEIDALADAVEPAIRQAHNIIGHGAEHIHIYNGPVTISNFDSQTKRYINTTIKSALPEIKLVSTAMYSANTKNGRVFDLELKKTVPISILPEAADRTPAVISTSLNRYASGHNDNRVFIKYYADKDPEGRIKRYRVIDAWLELDSPPA